MFLSERVNFPDFSVCRRWERAGCRKSEKHKAGQESAFPYRHV
jgi:hypothetical protein